MVVQEMVPSERSGVMFTVDPSTGETDHIVIEAAFGQGEVVVSGQVEPDTYVVAKDGPRLLHARVGTQHFKIVRGPDGEDQRRGARSGRGRPPGPQRRGSRRGGPHRPGRRGALRLAAGHGVGHGRWPTYLVQSRPVTAVGGAAAAPAPHRQGTLLVQGLAASAGRASGVGACAAVARPGRSPAAR